MEPSLSVYANKFRGLLPISLLARRRILKRRSGSRACRSGLNSEISQLALHPGTSL